MPVGKAETRREVHQSWRKPVRHHLNVVGGLGERLLPLKLDAVQGTELVAFVHRTLGILLEGLQPRRARPSKLTKVLQGSSEEHQCIGCLIPSRGHEVVDACTALEFRFRFIVLPKLRQQLIKVSKLKLAHENAKVHHCAWHGAKLANV